MSSLLCLRGSACSDLLRGAYSSLDALKAKRFLRAVAVLRSHSASIQARALEPRANVRVSSDSSQARCNYRHRSAARALRAQLSDIERAGLPTGEALPESQSIGSQAAKATTRHSQARGPLYRPRAASRAAPTAPCPSARLGDLSLEDLRLPFIVSAKLRYRRRHEFPGQLEARARSNGHGRLEQPLG